MTEPQLRQPGALGELPPFPRIALNVLELLSKPDVEAHQVTAAISLDSAFSAELLRVANSPLMALQREIKTVRHATTLLGYERLRALTMTVALRAYYRQHLSDSVLRRCWLHSLACGLIAEQLAKPSGVQPDLGHAAGLLHDVGRLGLVAAHPAEFSRLIHAARNSSEDILGMERKRFGMDHCQVGEFLAQEWRLPLELSVAAAQHHNKPEPQEPTVVTLVRFSCQLADMLGFEAVRPSSQWMIQNVLRELAEVATSLWRIDIEKLGENVRQRINSIEHTA